MKFTFIQSHSLKAVLQSALITALLLTAMAGTSAAQVAVIANKSLNVKTIDNNTLINLYTLQSNEVGAQKVKLFFLTKENETNKKFLETVKQTFQDLKKIWLRAKLTGNGTAPEFVNSESEMLEKVTSTPNSIGFINLKEVAGEVKVLIKI